MMNYNDIPQYPRAAYEVDVFWNYLDTYIYGKDNDPNTIPLIMEPDYQRGHVWSQEQQIAYVEYGMMGGENSMHITTNCPGWMRDFRGPYELVDGLQRVTAVLKFMRNELPIFGGHYRKDFTGVHRSHLTSFKWRVLNLPTRKEVLNLYLLLNTGGVVHSSEEIARVRKLLEQEHKENE